MPSDPFPEATWVPVMLNYDADFDAYFTRSPRLVEVQNGKPRDIGRIWVVRIDQQTGAVVADVEYYDAAVEAMTMLVPVRLIPVHKRDTGKLIALALEYGQWAKERPVLAIHELPQEDHI